jgi:outer membrane protein assembly factor BamB
VTGHDAVTGQQLWLHSRPGSSSNDANASLATIVPNDQILLTKGYGMGGELVQISHKEDGSFQVSSLWKSQRVLKTKLTNAIVSGDFVYAVSNELLECVDLQSGERRWRAPSRFGHGQILVVNDKILAHTEHGELVMCALTPDQYRELGRIRTIDGVCWNTIGIFGNKILVRSEQEMACYELPLRSNSASTAQTTPDPFDAAANLLSANGASSK